MRSTVNSSIIMVFDDFNDFKIIDCIVCCVAGRSVGNLITIFHIMIVLHNPNLIAFVSNMQRQKVIICGWLPSELFSISWAVGGPVFLVQAQLFIFLSSHRRVSFVTESAAGDIWWFLRLQMTRIISQPYIHSYTVYLVHTACSLLLYAAVSVAQYLYITSFFPFFWH